MTASLIFDKANACANQIKHRFSQTGTIEKFTLDDVHGIDDTEFTSIKYRKAHISIVDARETKKLWLLHVTVFPHTNDSSPIFGFDIVAGPNKVSGAFHDFSVAGDSSHPMLEWFANQTIMLSWNKKRELPDWAKNIFSDSMVAIGAVGPDELDNFINLGLTTLDYYLDNVGIARDNQSNYSAEQNRYCYYQKQNPHTPRVLVNLGFTEEEARRFVEDQLFPEVI